MTAARRSRDDEDLHKGAVEGDRPDDRHQGNPNGPGIDEDGLPDDPRATAEDRIGANVDDGEVANANESGGTTSAVREELKPLN